jgi:cell division transport system permease protein
MSLPSRRGGRRGRRLSVLLGNASDLVLGDAVRSWTRNLRTVTPALGTMWLLLVLAGLFTLGALAARNLVQRESRDASVVHVYLKDGVADQDVATLTARLRRDPGVASVRSVSKEEALRSARSRPGLPALAGDASTNPFPASLEVRLHSLADAGRVAGTAARDPAVDPAFPTSYDAGSYQRLQSFVTSVGLVLAGLLLLLTLVATVVTVNGIRAAILGRRDDIATMHLVGASGWMIRGPFVFEGALTGSLAGLLAAAVLVAAFAGLQDVSARTFSQLLPGVDCRAAGICAAGVLAGGAMLGSFASLIGVRGLRA